MPKDSLWETEKRTGLVKHHVFGGSNRRISEEDGLFIYLTPEMHNMSDYSIHFNQPFMDYAQAKGQVAWMEYYGRTKEQFIERYGRSYI